MPTAARRRCAAPGCINLVPCIIHGRQDRAFKQRFSKGAYGRPWRRRREAHIQASPENVWCQECLKDGQRTPVEHVDHVVPHRGDPELMAGPLQSLCAHHHGQKTAREVRSR